MHNKVLFEFQELEEMNLPQELLFEIRQTLDDVLLSKNSKQISCDLKTFVISKKENKVFASKKRFVKFSIFPTGIIFIDIEGEEYAN